ncbi:aminoacylase 1-like protein 2 [Coprinopsis cinerea okayama7|uniref:Aminoacylase 1-like protein 2 n=1 Tax=Coprinopsis cinerea (strain Okayama-7 / 130 / ATCC MYA-4618 / FGSC 9003) TaxID=240176 RepID=A8N8X6_COPC7|nr:aminoacylase 1-like protein 2 [Coprinopsis cinerea okayama7\|eukprot:XP_001831304.2 aminoacylase 1-like protein 2 [Coprinopsis cinerea okayama7\
MQSLSPLSGCFSAFFARSRRRVQRDNPSSSVRETEPVPSAPSRSIIDHPTSKEHPPCWSPCCDFSSKGGGLWSPVSQLESPPSYSVSQRGTDSNTDISVVSTIEQTLDSLDAKLRELSLDLHEIMFEEKYAHDLLTGFLSEQGFQVTRHYLPELPTAWRAEFSFGVGGRVVGVNSEMDALPGIGHACGHNLIAVSGVGVALSLKAAMEKHKISGKIVLLGTPAEEAGGGKVILLERGAYNDMDVCLMCHPSPGEPHSASIGPTIAMQAIEVEFFGHSAHAGAAPWEGTNALDAAFLAYSSISMLRQQLKPDHRIHGVIQGKDWSPNGKAAGMATSCSVDLKTELPYYDLRQNTVLAQYFSDVVSARYGVQTTDAALPVIHPAFAIPTLPHGGNHTPAFEKAAKTQKAHEAMMAVTKGLALTGLRVLNDASFLSQVQTAFTLDSAGKPTS